MDLRSTYDLQSLAHVLDCSPKQLGYYIYKRDLASQYKQFRISKKSGGHRIISAPATNLKIIQKSIARELTQLVHFKPCVTGFVAGRDIKRNASNHVGQRNILNVDLEDFFGTINFGRVYGLLSKSPFRLAPKVAAAIAKACTLENKLPQGAPTSPVLSNLICAKLDTELTRLSLSNKCIYSRYADDLTFSTNRRVMPLASINQTFDGANFADVSPRLRTIIEENGFRINEKKVRIANRTNRQTVTGLVVNKRINVHRSLIREVRAMLHAWKKFGLLNTQKNFEDKFHGHGLDFESVVRGKIGFIGQIRGRPDEPFKKLAIQFNYLTKGGKIRTALSDKEVAEQAVWVIEHDGDTQGSAFFLEKFGLVTCAHCLGDNPLIYHPTNHTKKFPVTIRWRDKHRDLAVLDIPKELAGVIPLRAFAGLLPDNGTDILLLGYPNHAFARPVRLETGKLLRFFNISAVSYLEISPKIIGGNSGGPVLNNKFEVIGIAVLGTGGSTEITSAEFLAVSHIELAAFEGRKRVTSYQVGIGSHGR